MSQNPATWFPDHTIEPAPPAARRSTAATEKHLGYLPAAVARMAVSPHLLDGFGKLSAIFESSTLDPVAREVLVMTIATTNRCHICVAMHTTRLTALGADADTIARLRNAAPLAGEHLEAIRMFTLGVLATAGDVGDEALRRLPRPRLHPARTHSRWSSGSAPAPCPPWPAASPAPPSTTS